jgi:hypothetical protein
LYPGSEVAPKTATFHAADRNKTLFEKKTPMKNVAFLLLIICSDIFAQQNKRILFDSLKTYHYNALFINKDGDTLSNEKLILQPTGKIWESDKNQDLVMYYYTPIEKVLSQFSDLSSRKDKKFQFYGPITYNTGVIETDSLV